MCATEIGFSRRARRVAYVDNLPVLMIHVRMYMTKKKKGSRSSLNIELTIPVNFTEVYCTSKKPLISNDYFLVILEVQRTLQRILLISNVFSG